MSRPAILLIMRDPPETETRKGGLFPTAIQHHCDIGLDVHVAALGEMNARHRAVLQDLGATALILQPQGLAGRLRAALGRPASPQDLLVVPGTIDRISREIAPIAVTGLQSYHTGMVARRIGQRLGVPYVTWEHLTTYQTGGRIRHSDAEMRTFFTQSHATAVVSPAVAQAIRSRFSIDLPQAQVVVNPIPTGWTDPPATPAPAWIAEFGRGRRLIGAWTSWRKIKRVDLLLEAFARVHDTCPDSALVIAGPMRDDSAEVVARFQAARQDLADAVLLPGNLDRATIRHLAATVECCCVPSDHETFGLAVVEALALGTPVVATRCGGPEYIIDSPWMGRLCPRDDVGAMASALLDVLNQRAGFKGAAIAATILDRYGPQALHRAWRGAYAGLLPEELS